MYTEEELKGAQMPDTTPSIVPDILTELLKKKDRIILEAVTRVLGREPSKEEIIKHGGRNVDTFGNETYYWDGKIIVEFPKQDHVVNRPDDLDFYYTVEQRYRLHV